MSDVWCEEKNKGIGDLGRCKKPRSEARKQYGCRIRCPKCKQRFEPIVMECSDPGCWHVYLPKHKPKIKKIKKQTKKTFSKRKS